MASDSEPINLRPIGVVHNNVSRSPGSGYAWASVTSEIVLDPALAEGLDGIEDFSHLIVLYWMHRLDRKLELKLHPRGRKELPLVGVFASRSPNRPNSIGKATIKLLERRGHILKVSGLDAIDGSPVLDIKPYIPAYDAPADARVPPWTSRP